MKKTIVVVGAGRGLGNGVAEMFGRNDFRVILVARSEKHLKEYAADFAAKGIEVYTQAADVADFDAFAQTFRKVVETYGTPDVLFYNVGVTVADGSAEMTTQTLVDRYVVDVAGAYNCVKLVDTDEFAKKRARSWSPAAVLPSSPMRVICLFPWTRPLCGRWSML